ncbi:TetR/AcrR family transcriptional regulator [Pedobacter cryoconitis]|uniref:TetR family transcriptional regulator n=1 Tax=Pedobacter cryoconitis TaxID=188932 RepID=A0A327SH31_9SPHI|nr:TetR/AcrR family transcriptional regulator [Pedobacter cryoconitis]RAJ28141.1 TetR family transcriptional regulator [Pedobacter cryoconitis]
MRKSVQTRLNILQKSFELIYVKGYQSTSIDDILSSMEVTKGAFFYHFKNKEEMGLALITDLLYPRMKHFLIEPLSSSADPIKSIYQMIANLLKDTEHFDVKYGCPAVNLIEEMSPLNTAFHKHLKDIVGEWTDAIEKCLLKGKENGKIGLMINPAEAAAYIVSGYAGVRNIGKMLGTPVYQSYLKQFKLYLNSLT